jgi:hypothetical protein
MSRATFAMDVDAAKPASRLGGGVRVSKPGDAHEVEADRVADTVVRGGRVPGWSLSAMGFSGRRHPRMAMKGRGRRMRCWRRRRDARRLRQ